MLMMKNTGPTNNAQILKVREVQLWDAAVLSSMLGSER